MTWDTNKNQLNMKNHGISFEEAQEVFNDPNAIEIYDQKHSIDEDRYICLGALSTLVIILVVYTDKNGNTRLISARTAEKIEKEAYYEHIKKTFGRN